LAIPHHHVIDTAPQDSRTVAEEDERRRLAEAVDDLRSRCDVIVLDCPGGDPPLARSAHQLADCLVTPINDSFVDLDLLLQFRPGSFQVLDLGVYFRLIWQIRNERRKANQDVFDWVVLRNRLSGLADQNKRNLIWVLEKIAPIMRFRLADGLGERIIFRQLFQQGLTVFDIDEPDVGLAPTKSHSAALGELHGLLDALHLFESDEMS
jgi:chromosome partitioning protein